MSTPAFKSQPWSPGSPVHAEGYGVVLRSFRAQDIDDEFMARFRDPLVTQHIALAQDPARLGLKVHKLAARAYDDNAASVEGAQATGWVREGLLREHEPDGKGGRRNVVVFGMLRADHLVSQPAKPYEVAKK